MNCDATFHSAYSNIVGHANVGVQDSTLYVEGYCKIIRHTMDWLQFKTDFIHTATHKGKDSDYIDSCLQYAQSLYLQNLPIIFDTNHFSLLVGYKLSYIMAVSNANQKFYTEFRLPKKSDGYRTIYAPYPSLKEIQRWLLDNILAQIKPSMYAKGFIPLRNIVDNAKYHKNKKLVLKLDIKDFFPSITFQMVHRVFLKCGYTKQLATLFANLCTLDRCLPQGAPTSPALSNLVFLSIDKRIGGYTAKKRIMYTRYADDLTFSGNLDPAEIISLLQLILSDNGLSLNSKKTRLMHNGKRQIVTGIVVNSKLNAPKEIKNEITSAAYYISKYGIISHLNHIKSNYTAKDYLQRMIGKANFILHVNPKSESVKSAKKILQRTYKEITALG